ncbi:hypothetical protein M413DRAFT_445326 [Hebeloma cylindrosporum]|uniref:HMG box domain-containing protein n=1 Tax=Hebeloma cylindrosporum TaxID=76867 RepID=A0A0C2YJT2_HEBCY|nr:hypothetical protein M413DRAFT_445326 [Hebeloma cylindrosporum h7]
MLANAGRSTRQSDGDRDSVRALTTSRKDTAEDFGFGQNGTAKASESASTFDGGQFEFDHDRSAPRRGRKKPVNHIPRPPNAFILFRSAFIKSRHVSTGVETNHSTLSKIIGITWQNLPEEERQKWHSRAKVAQDEHKRKFPQYTFRPVHKAKGPAAERKRQREVGPKDQKRCAKIAELLVCGKKGQELEEAIQEFDKHHVPEIVTRFETPITANTFSSSGCEQRSFPSTSSRKGSASPKPRNISRQSSSSHSPSPYPASEALEALEIPNTAHSFNTPSFDYPSSSHSFDLDQFAFTITQPSPVLPHGSFTPVVTPNAHSFDSSITQDISRLCGNSHYMEEWARQGSPMSNSTCSMPSTPSHMTIPFPEPYPTFTSDTASDYQALEAPYCDFTPYPSYAPISEPNYGRKESTCQPSGFNHFHPEQTAPPIVEDHLNYSLMASLRPY